MKILVTGIAGFIGSHTGERLIKEGHQVIGVDNFDAFYPKKFKEYNLEFLNQSPNFKFYEEDIRNKVALLNIFRDNDIDAVIHLAAKAGVRPSIENIGEYYDVNINGSIALFEAMLESNIKKIVFASSSSVYGNTDTVPFSEDQMVDNPISPYAATKKSGELLSHVYAHLYGFDITCLRFFTVFGPRQRPDLAIHKFTRMIDMGQPIPFFGDGSTSRDYTFIVDIVEGIICALNNLQGYHVYNLGESKVIKLHELVSNIEKALNKSAVIDKKPFQPGDVQKTFANITRAKTEIGYSPSYNFEDGIKLFVEWYNKHKEILYK